MIEQKTTHSTASKNGNGRHEESGSVNTPQNISALIWSVADLLRGDYKQADYGKVILPFTLLRRLDCVLEGTKEEVLREHTKNQGDGPALDRVLKRKSKQAFYNTSPFTMQGLLADQKH